MTTREWARALWRRRYLLIPGAAVFAVAVLVAAPHVWELKYTGTTIFELRMDPASEALPGGRTTSLPATQKTIRDDLVEREAVAQAAEELGLMRGLPRGPDGDLTEQGKMDKWDLVKRLKEGMTVSPLTGETGVIYRGTVSFTHSDPDLARAMPDLLVKNCTTRIRERITDRLTDSREFLERRYSTADARVDEVMRQKLDFEAQQGGLLPDDPGVLAEQMRRIEKDIDTRRLQLADERQEYERLKVIVEGAKDVGNKPTQTVRGPNPELKDLKDELRRFENELDRAKSISRMTDRHPTVKMLRRKIEKLQKEIEQTPKEIEIQKIFGQTGAGTDLALKYATLADKVDSGTKELARLQARRKAIQEIITNYAPVRQRYVAILNALEDAQAERNTWEDQLTEVKAALAAEAASKRIHLEIVQGAQKEFRPSSPTLEKVLGIALAGGILFGGALVFLAKTLDQSISTTREADAHFGLPVCGVIGEIATRWQRFRRKARQWFLEPAVGLVLLAVVAWFSFDSVLWLQYPQMYQDWKSNPTDFIGRNAAKVLDGVKNTMQDL